MKAMGIDLLECQKRFGTEEACAEAFAARVADTTMATRSVRESVTNVRVATTKPR